MFYYLVEMHISDKELHPLIFIGAVYFLKVINTGKKVVYVCSIYA